MSDTPWAHGEVRLTFKLVYLQTVGSNPTPATGFVDVMKLSPLPLTGVILWPTCQ